MNLENPFFGEATSDVTPEQKVKNSELRRRIANEIRGAGFDETMKADQYSVYHTEGEHVSDHYRAIFNVMLAIQHPDDERFRSRLPEGTREALADLEASVAETIREFPSLMRYVVMAHDIAKQNQSRNVNPKNFNLPEDEGADSPASRYAAERCRIEEDTAGLKSRREELDAKGKAAKKDPVKSASLKQEREGVAAEIAENEEQIAAATVDLYDALRASGMSGQAINERYGLGVGFIGHETASADKVRGMDLPENLRGIMAKIAEDHILPLMRFGDKVIEDKRGRNKDGSYKKSEEQVCAESYRDTYKDYSEIEYRLSAAMGALDILGSVPKSGKPDLTPIRRMVVGKRENELQETIKEHMQAEIDAELSRPESPYKDVAGVDFADHKNPRISELRKLNVDMRQVLEKRLRDRYCGLI